MKTRNVVLIGGPWDCQQFRVPKPGRNINAAGERISLCIRVREHVGTYCLVTGCWEPRDTRP